MLSINSKTASRIAAIQALYQYKINNLTSTEVENIINGLIDYYQDHFSLQDSDQLEEANIKIKLKKMYFRDLVYFSINNLETVDQILVGYLNNGWKLESLHFSLQAVLRVGITELKFFPETPPKVIIDEYTSIAAEMLKHREVSFVNHLLDKISKELKHENAE